MTAVATKSTARSKAKNAPGVASAVVATPPPPVVTVAAAVAEILERVDQAYSGLDKGTICTNAHTLIDVARDELQRLVDLTSSDEAQSIHRVAACVAGAYALDLAETPTCTARHELLASVSEAMESAAISFGFCEEPCEALAHGIAAGIAVQAGRQPAHDDASFDADDLAGEAMALSHLMDWIVSARDTLVDIRVTADTSPPLAQALRDERIPYRSPEWRTDEAGAGVAYMLSRQQVLISQLAQGGRK